MSTVLITGASKGIGKATAYAFARAGWDLLLVARSKNKLEFLRHELNDLGVKVFCECVDLSDAKNINSGINNLLRQGQHPSVLINNAGIAWTGELLSMPLDQWNKTMQINVTSVFQICSAVLPHMRKKGGLVINVSSHAARNAFPNWSAYCVSKAALNSFTRCLAEEERSFGIRACTLTLGSVNSELWDSETVQCNFDRQSMLSVDEVAYQLLHISQQPVKQVIEDMTFMPSAGIL